ncbi:Predicted N-acetyltransferase YhbS [Meinhardsimonia xiamenensis]|uniref:Predicted N-acetyltransferase YhbS n=1 Tax=Meinhardsimonia xiamenensis TaxID=990712 RepID=A0A1G9AQQ7_9RHOB|nr:N-acetyltransferase [Meinhardsimonia xiamenensis]PRX35279.1 putative N-acetyltransferase YhbS [Meinhardsimonia xiamenensis]SDK29706.1 Predicted N-acetyltransferase YhbS [Meinhardsimonia xiamenensis]
MDQLSVEGEADWWEVEALFDLCFAPGREALSSYRLREGVEPVTPLCLILRDQAGALAAAIRYWPVVIGDPAHEALLLGPVATHPIRQGEGLAAWLIRESLARAAGYGWRRVMLVGDEPYYGRFGFRRLEGVEMPPPTNPDRVLGLTLGSGDAWMGVCGKVRPWPAGRARPGAPLPPPQGGSRT